MRPSRFLLSTVTGSERSVLMRPSGGIPQGAHGHHTEDRISPEAQDGGSAGPSGRDAGAVRNGDVRVLVTVLRPGSAARHARAVVREVLREAGLDDEAVGDAEVVAAELAANAERHARPPYELRVVSLDGVPAWCEVVDGDPDLREVRIILDLLDSVEEIGLPLLAENGRGLLLAHRLSRGRCHVHPTATHSTGTPGKAVVFALPTRSSICPPFPASQAGGGLGTGTNAIRVTDRPL
ncbi:ATP-binding protein [Streptosporangium sp. DT93]|uniref:ATP-binding protein n=1 Tax=Streptosporangium sp. DT93 TaxID=3393428 RepID=UPI003CECECB7